MRIGIKLSLRPRQNNILHAKKKVKECILFKMFLEDVKWNGKEEPCVLVFGNAKDGGNLTVEIPESVGFDLRTLLNQKLQGMIPYFGICDLVKQVGGTIKKLIIRDEKKPGTAVMVVEVGGKIKETELFFGDIVSVAIILDMPIYFDDAVCFKRETTLSDRLRWTRTESITNYSFDTKS
jgi:bifunctional DNase/RNase